jgi:hypothetical protein
MVEAPTSVNKDEPSTVDHRAGNILCRWGIARLGCIHTDWYLILLDSGTRRRARTEGPYAMPLLTQNRVSHMFQFFIGLWSLCLHVPCLILLGVIIFGRLSSGPRSFVLGLLGDGVSPSLGIGG